MAAVSRTTIEDSKPSSNVLSPKSKGKGTCTMSASVNEIQEVREEGTDPNPPGHPATMR